MQETFEPVLLERKAAAIRKSTSNSQLQARTNNKRRTPAQILTRATVRPLKMLLLPIILPLSLNCAFMFGLTYLLFTTFPAVFETTYKFATDISGLTYLGLGVGMIISIGLFAVLSDKLLKQPREGTLERPELRLILIIWSAPIIPIGFFWYGWSADKVTHWIVPILGTMFIALGAFLIFIPA
ncbi:Major facilitator superfamily domain, general substrate transporter [Penicillium expansum]|uniref:Major facilitator superfamily domain, general substrate transporter n=1 Tax=Penicillium expansum TaxID=27334 RepID=A0A0A2IDI6_PENEN|nr:Major facilitator superfamily domain, general substrate transporter [Penicillium expansum]KGO40486.1 Major facilitator superfamily domain, general substrate transporter [Penicillium expansum]KGO59710.1 Major facilitator superfamily domain, general substrate transporter [Penicillium expansum]KGO63754.1 Major facilitator superfamily domain, general substrate transporter [Penicillium expansum]